VKKRRRGKQKQQSTSRNLSNKQPSEEKTFSFHGFPVVLWALGLFIVSLGVNFKLDIPLALFALVAVYTLGRYDFLSFGSLFLQSWHIGLFVFISLVVTVTSRDLAHSLEVQTHYLPALLVYAVILLCVTKRKYVEFVFCALVLAGLVTSGGLLFEVLSSTENDALEKVKDASSPVFVSPNDVLFFVVLAPFAMALFFIGGNVKVKILSIAYLLLVLFVSVYLQSRQAVGVYVVVVFTFSFLIRPLWGLVLGGGALLAVLMLDFWLGKGLINKVLLFPRVYVWETAWQMFLDRPVVGHGPGAFKQHYYEYLERAGYAYEEVKDRRPMNWAHSLYLEQLAEKGLLGLSALLVLILRPFSKMVRSWLFVREQSRDALYFVSALLAAFVGFLLAGVAESSLLRIWVVVTLFVLVGLSDIFEKAIRNSC